MHGAQFLYNLGDERGDRRRFCDVALFGDDFHAERARFVGDFIELFHFRAGAQREIGAFFRKCDGGEPAHIAAGARNQYDLAFKSGIHGFSLLFVRDAACRSCNAGR